MGIEFRNASEEVIAFFANIDTEKANRVVLRTIALDVESIEDADGRQYVQVVRCRDCKHYGIVCETYDDTPVYGCHYLSFSNARIDDFAQEPQDPDGYCAWGERIDKLPGIV